MSARAHMQATILNNINKKISLQFSASRQIIETKRDCGTQFSTISTDHSKLKFKILIPCFAQFDIYLYTNVFFLYHDAKYLGNFPRRQFSRFRLPAPLRPFALRRSPYVARLVPLDLCSRSIARDADACTWVEFLWGETLHSFVPFAFTAISPQIYIHTNSYRASSSFLDRIGNASQWMQRIHARPFNAHLPFLDPFRLEFFSTLVKVLPCNHYAMKLHRRNKDIETF